MRKTYTDSGCMDGGPAHIRVREAILSWIRSGQLAPGDKLPAEPELASQFGVARMTANKAVLSLTTEGWLTRSPGRGTFVAKAWASLKKCYVAFSPSSLVGTIEDHYYGTVYWNISPQLAELGIACVPASFRDLPREIDIDSGIIAINPAPSFRSELARLQSNNASIVVLGSSWTGIEFPYVDSDNVLGTTLAVNHLIDLGHREFAFWGAYAEDTNTQDRVRGYRSALIGRGLSADPDRIMLAAETDLNPMEEFKYVQWLKSGVTAIIAGGAHTAMHALMIAQMNGYSVPGDVSIVGYDDPEYMRLVRPAITTVCQPLAAIAARACEILVATRSGSADGASTVFDPKLIIRDSTSNVKSIG